MCSQQFRITCVIPLFNKERTLRVAIDSVLRQTVSRIELIVVNDGSTDGSVGILRSIRDKRIRLITQENGGVSAARNHGARLARTSLVAFLDADDWWAPTFLETILDLENRYRNCGAYATGYKMCRADGVQRLPFVRGLSLKGHETIINEYWRFLAQGDPPFNSSSIAIKKDCLFDVGGFPEGINAGEDQLLWIKLNLRYPIGYSSLPLAFYTVPSPGDRPVRTPDNSDRLAEEIEQVISGVAQSQADGLRQFLSYWYKVRAATYLMRGKPEKARPSIKKALGIEGRSWKLYVYAVLARLPARMSRWAFLFLLRLSDLRRS